MSEQNFAAEQYAPRAADYVTSAVHAQGEDLDQIEALVTGHAEAVALDLGCGGGHVSYRAAPHVARVVAVDVTASMLEQVAANAAARGMTNIETRLAPAEALPFPDASFDIVLCRFTAHHWQNLAKGLAEARRVLKPGGRGLFIDTVCPASRVLDTHMQAVELLRDLSHVRNYSIAEWVAELARAGFTVQGTTLRRLHMEFASWTARTRTAPDLAAAIRHLQDTASPEVRSHFNIGADGSFDIEAAAFEVTG